MYDHNNQLTKLDANLLTLQCIPVQPLITKTKLNFKLRPNRLHFPFSSFYKLPSHWKKTNHYFTQKILWNLPLRSNAELNSPRLQLRLQTSPNKTKTLGRWCRAVWGNTMQQNQNKMTARFNNKESCMSLCFWHVIRKVHPSIYGPANLVLRCMAWTRGTYTALTGISSQSGYKANQ